MFIAHVVSGMRRFTPALLLFTFPSFAQTWTQLPDFPGIARDDASAFAIGTDVFVGTGMDVGFSLTTDWYKYNTTANTWSSIAALPASGRQYTTSFSINGVGYLFGGTDGNALNELWAYDPQQDQWTARAPLPSAGRSGSVAFVQNGKGFVTTGKKAPDFKPTSELWMYDPVLDHWSQRSDLPGVPRALASAFTVGDTAYLFTGLDSLGVSLADGWKYVAATGTWSFIGPFGGNAMFGADGFGLNVRGVIVCGAFTSPPYAVSTEVYDPTIAQWTETPVFTGPGRKGGSGAVVGNTIYYGTGTTGLARLNDWYKLEWPVGIEEIAAAEGPRIIGSIVGEELDLLIPSAWTNARAEIIDATGRSERSMQCITGSHTIGVSGLATGSYFLRITSERESRTLPFTVIH